MAVPRGTLAEISVDALALRSTASLARREALQAGLLAALIGILLVLLGPPAGDAAAHLYRTELVRDGVLVWDNLWYGGQYPLASYSLLFYFPAALVGDVALVLAAVAAAAVLFARIAGEEWGREARWPVRAFAVAACAPLFTGTYAWAVGLATLLGALRALQCGRPWLSLLLAGLTFGFSPLAFVFLCIVLVTLALVHRPDRRTVAILGGGLVTIAGLALALAATFPTAGRYGFRATELAWALLVATGGAAISFRSPRARALAWLFVVWGATCVLAFLIPSPLGSNLTRFRELAFPLLLLATILAGFRPRWLAAVAVVGGLAYTVTPYAAVATQLTDSRPAGAAFWESTTDFLRGGADPGYRVDVVPTFDNWEAYELPRAGIALTRGWYRQLDLARNPVLYGDAVDARAYRAWLRSLGVRYVVLPHTPLDRVAAAEQARLLRSGASGLTEVFSDYTVTIYELPHATPILTGPARAELTAFEHARIAGRVAAPGSYLLRVRYTPYWSVRQGDICLGRAPGGMTRVEVHRAGPFELGIPGAATLARSVLGARPSAC